MAGKSTNWFTKAVFALGILLTPFSAAGQASNAVPVSGGPVVTQFNTPAVNAPVRVCPVTAIGNPCDTTGVTLYSDYNLTQPINNPTATNAQGVYNAFTVAGFYLIQINPTPGMTYSYYYLQGGGGGGGGNCPDLTAGDGWAQFALSGACKGEFIDYDQTYANTLTVSTAPNGGGIIIDPDTSLGAGAISSTTIYGHDEDAAINLIANGKANLIANELSICGWPWVGRDCSDPSSGLTVADYWGDFNFDYGELWMASTTGIDNLGFRQTPPNETTVSGSLSYDPYFEGVDATDGDKVVSLPDITSGALGNCGETYLIAKEDGTGNTVTPTAYSGQTIAGSATYVLSSQYQSVEIVSNCPLSQDYAWEIISVGNSGGGSGDTITSPNSTLTVGGSSTNTTLDLNLSNVNTWLADQNHTGTTDTWQVMSPSNPAVAVTNTGVTASNGVGQDVELNSSGVAINSGGSVVNFWNTNGGVTTGTGTGSVVLSISPALTGTVNASGAAQFKLPVGAGYTSAANGEIGYDSSNLNWHAWVNGADMLMVPLAAGFVSGDCAQPTQTGNSWFLGDSGAACGSGGSGNVSSVTNSDSTLTVSPTTGAVVASLNLTHANTWTALQTFGTDISIGGVTPSGATGTGSIVFATSPTLVTPALGTPASGVITNLTGTCTGCTANAVTSITGTQVGTAANLAQYDFYLSGGTSSAPTGLACAANRVLEGSATTPSCTATAQLGASGTLGSLTFGNASSGTLTLQTVPGALGTVTASLPDNTGTLAELNLAQTFSAVQTISASNGLKLSAMTGTSCLEEVSGVVTATGGACPPAGGVTSVGLALPASTFTVSGSPVTGSGTLTGSLVSQAANTFFRGPNSGAAATPGWGGIVSADIPSNAANTSGQAGSVANALTGNSSGGASPGTTYTGATAVTFDYHTLGAAPAIGCTTVSSLSPANNGCYQLSTSSSVAMPSASAFTIFTVQTESGATATFTSTTLSSDAGCSGFLSGSTLALTGNHSISVKSDGTNIWASCI